MPKLNLEEFIYQVKKELLEGQEKHEGEPGYFRLRDVELEVSVAASYSGEGKLNLQVVQIGSEVAREHTHKVKLIFDLVPPNILGLISQTTDASSSDREPVIAPLRPGQKLIIVEPFGPFYVTEPTGKRSDLALHPDAPKGPATGL